MATAATELTETSEKRARGGWLSDFEFRGLAVTVKKTGATTRLDWQVLHEVAVWVRFWVIVRAVALWRLAAQRNPPTLRFQPTLPRPWYFIRSAAAWAGVRVVSGDQPADGEICFDDATWTASGWPHLARTLNFRAIDISKSTVSRIFDESFGYRLTIDPATHVGRAVEKGEINSMHDGQIVDCPKVAVPGKTYQRFVDTEGDGTICDLRTSIVAGVPVLVCAKTRKPHDRFASINNVDAELWVPAAVFSAEEIAAIGRFAKRLGLDWGTLDILRDADDGRIYIVDANKTDVGPVLALSLADQCRATAIVGAALRRFLISP